MAATSVNFISLSQHRTNTHLSQLSLSLSVSFCLTAHQGQTKVVHERFRDRSSRIIYRTNAITDTETKPPIQTQYQILTTSYTAFHSCTFTRVTFAAPFIWIIFPLSWMMHFKVFRTAPYTYCSPLASHTVLIIICVPIDMPCINSCRMMMAVIMVILMMVGLVTDNSDMTTDHDDDFWSLLLDVSLSVHCNLTL